MSAVGYGQTSDLSRVAKAGDTMTGPLRLVGSPPSVVTAGAVAGYVWTSDVAGNGSWQPATGGGGGNTTPYSRQFEVRADGPASIQVATVGVWTPTYLTNTDTGNFVGWVNISDGAQNDQISFDFACEAGTYSVELLHLPFQSRGIYTLKVDGATIGTIDGYATGLVPTRSKLTGVVLAGGQHVITVLMATKNASASQYLGMIERFTFTQTA